MKKLYEMMQDRANVATQMREILNKFERRRDGRGIHRDL